MVKVQIGGQEYYLDGILKKNLDIVKQQIRKDWDYLFIVDGEVGSGKSVFVQQLAHYVSDGKFNVDCICFDPDQFREAVLKAEKYTAIVFDEAFRGMSARAAMTATNRILMALLQEIRQKNLFIFIVLPSIWDLDKYVALHRTKGCFHVHTDKNKTRGFFRFYNKDQLMYLLKDYQMKYKYPKFPKFFGRFVKHYAAGMEEYKKKKSDSLGKYSYDKSEEDGKSSRYYDYPLLLKTTIKRLAKLKSITERTICDEIGLGWDTYSHISSSGRRKGVNNLEK